MTTRPPASGRTTDHHGLSSQSPWLNPARFQGALLIAVLAVIIGGLVLACLGHLSIRWS